MKRLTGLILLCGLAGLAQAQQQPTRPKSAPTTQTKLDSSGIRQTGLKERQRREQINDRRPTQEQPRRLRPDSLRRGGATDVDTLRR